MKNRKQSEVISDLRDENAMLECELIVANDEITWLKGWVIILITVIIVESILLFFRW